MRGSRVSEGSDRSVKDRSSAGSAVSASSEASMWSIHNSGPSEEVMDINWENLDGYTVSHSRK